MKRSLEDGDSEENASRRQKVPTPVPEENGEGPPPISGAVIERIEDEAGAGIKCLHEVAYPEGYDPGRQKRAAPQKPAKEYPFVLDPFQREAIRCLEAGESVLVSAHTSAGKTVVAEYAIAMALRDKQRVVYTSPIKALSNQKFRETSEEFADVGLMTGDVTIAPHASCLVMTTEILRSMLYRGAEVVREVGWIIFDEVHYMRDRERGVVWEEAIVMAPKSARFVFLSATLPNSREFADWIAKVQHQPCHIVYTDFRPTPLQHYIFPAGGAGLHLVVDEKGAFREDNFQKAVNALGADAAGGAGGPGGKGGGARGGARPTEGPTDIFKIVKMIMQRQYDPVIVFSFSKSDCEALATQMAKLDLNDEDEKKLVEGVFRNAIDGLSDDDKRLPQVVSILPLLRRGIGIHHSGLLPILKEVIEILFQEGLLKCLFATETFSIGLNMPAKTVVFTNVRKWDGDKFRWLTGGEYIQMSGRAGRRGLDDRGVCILMVDAKMEPAVAKGMVRGSADALDSAFHLTYSMVLNQMRSEDSDIERMMALSFAQFQAGRALPSLNKKVRQLEEERDGVVIEEQEHVEEYLSLQQQLRKLRQGVRAIVAAPQHALPFLSPGRIVRVLCRPYSEEDEEEEEEAGEGGRGQNGAAAGGGAAASGGGEAVAWGVVINFQKVATPKDLADEDEPERTEARYNVDVLAECREEESTSGRGRGHHVRPCGPHEHGEPTVVALPLSQVDRLSAVRVYIAKDLRPPEAREAALKALRQVQLRFPDGVPMLDPEDDMQVDSSSYRKGVRRIEAIEGLLASHPLAQSATLRTRLAALRHKERLTAAIKAAKREVKGASGLILKDELKARKRVLRRLGYITSDDVVEVKGRVACEISTGDELTLTELIFAGVFKDLSVPQLAALVSCFVWQEKTGSQTGSTKLREALSAPLSQLRDVARRVGKVQLECKMSIDVEEYVANFRPNIMEAVFAWCQGAKFSELLKMADVFEGSLIRALRRLEELMRQLATACKTIGETELEGRFQEAIEKMKRDIVFAASLYL